MQSIRNMWIIVFCAVIPAVIGNSTQLPVRDGSIRLAGSVSRHEGRLEIFHDGVWGTVCDDMFDMSNNGAVVACRSLGYSGGLVIGNRYGSGIGQIWLDNVRCNGSESAITECVHNEWGSHNCNHGEDVSISCYSNLPTTTSNPGERRVRLGGSISNREGRLEVFHANEWGTVCDDNFDEAEARVACFSLGFGRVGYASTVSYGYDSTTPIWLDDVQCLGNESSLEECTHRGWGQHNCGHHEDVYLTCIAAIRLAGSGSNLPREGRLEIYHNGYWGTVCDHLFNDQAAAVACAELGFDRSGEVRSINTYGQGQGTIWLDDIVCTGSEWTLSRCRHSGWGMHSCQHSNDVAIACFDVGSDARTNESAVRLVGGSDIHRGRLEIFHNGSWGTVCDRNFNEMSAKVACRSLKLGFVGEVLYNWYGPGIGNVWLADVMCNGHEASIADCPHSPWGSTLGSMFQCTHSSDVSIACYNDSRAGRTSEVRLVNGSSPMNGRLEVFLNGSWSTVCHHGFDDVDARVACYSLGFGRVGRRMPDSTYLQGVGNILIDYVSCIGYESSLLDCTYTSARGLCMHYEDVFISCRPENITDINQVQFRLAGNGSTNRQGRLEVYYSGIWGTVCDDGFDDVDARVACNSLGFGYNGWSIGNLYGPGTGQIWLDDLGCYGSEQSLSECLHSGWANHNCAHSEDVSIACYPDGASAVDEARLMDGDIYYQGRLEIRHQGIWGSVCNDAFNDIDAKVACNMLGFGYVGSTQHKRFGAGTHRIMLDNVQCVGTEKSIVDCKHYGWGVSTDCTADEAVSISCDGDEESANEPGVSHAAAVGLGIVTSVSLLAAVVFMMCYCKVRRDSVNLRRTTAAFFSSSSNVESSQDDDTLLLSA